MIFLRDISTVTVGKNPHRASDDPSNTYTTTDFEDDLHNLTDAPEDGDIIYYQTPSVGKMTTRAVVRSAKNKDKSIYQAFAVIHLTTKTVYPLYLCYLLNCSQNVEHQLQRLTQGSVRVRMFAGNLKDVSIEVPDIATQMKIGKAYAQAVRGSYLEKLHADAMLQSVVTVLRRLDKN